MSQEQTSIEEGREGKKQLTKNTSRLQTWAQLATARKTQWTWPGLAVRKREFRSQLCHRKAHLTVVKAKLDNIQEVERPH